MKKGIAVPYIIALILGIAVLALIGYWFFVLGGRIPGEATATWCQTKQNTWCGHWAQTAGFPSEGWDSYATGCTGINYPAPDETRCQQILGVSGGGGGGGGTGDEGGVGGG